MLFVLAAAESRASQARDGKLTLEDMAGGSFTMCVLPSSFVSGALTVL